MLCTYCDKVTMIDVIECSGCITIHSDGISVSLVTVRRHITSTKHSVVNMHTTLLRVLRIHLSVQIVTSEQVGPLTRPVTMSIFLFPQGVQVVCLKVFILIFGLSIDGSTVSPHLKPRCNNHLTVLLQIIIIIIIIDVVWRTGTDSLLCLRAGNAGTINITDITSTKHVAVPLCHTVFSTHFTAVDMYLCLAKHITIRIECSLTLSISQKIVALTATKHIAKHMTVKHLHICLTRLIKAL